MTYKHIGKDFTPPDIRGKVTGKAKYAEDFTADGMAYARLLTSPMPHGQVKKLDVGAALAMDGVYGVITAHDLPESQRGPTALLTNEPLFVGDPILAVAAVDEKTAEDAIGRIQLDLAPLPFAVAPTDSLRPGGASAQQQGNVFVRSRGGGGGTSEAHWRQEDLDRFLGGGQPPQDAPIEWRYGDLEAGFDNAEITLEESFVTTGYAHNSMEPRSTMSYWQNGRCFVYGSTQSQSFVIPHLAAMIGIAPENLTYVAEFCGGGFGSKIGPYPTMVLTALFAKQLGRPVMLRITREEEYYIGSARVGFQGWIKAGFASSGRVSAVDLYIVQDVGSKGTGGDASSAGGAVSILYQPQAVRLRSLPVLTNTTPRGAQRGPGQNQIAAVFEPMLDKAARALGMDRVDIRKVNAPNSGAALNADQSSVTSAYMAEALSLGAKRWNWTEKIKRSGRRKGSKVTGIGVGQGYHSAGASGFDGLLRIAPDGKVHLHSGVGNLGTYSYASTVRAAAEALQVDWARCEVVHGNSALHLPWSSYQAGSNTLFTHTRANHVAAMDAIAKLKEVAARTLGGVPEDYDIDGERVFSMVNPATALTYGEAAAEAIELGGKYSGEEAPEDIHEVTRRALAGIAGTGLVGVAKDDLPKRGTAPGFAIGFVEMELDLETGKHEIIDYLGVGECGTVVHPLGLAGQLRGGAVWGFGMATMERHVYDAQNGLPANVGFYQCKPPTYLDVPSEMDWAAADIPDPDNPVGARGIGEPAMGCAVAALMCAFSDALGGHLFNRTPITPDLVLNHLAGLSSTTGLLAINTY